VCIALYIETWVNGYSIGDNSIGLGPVMVWKQYYRILSSTYYHLGVLHLFFNMSSVFYLMINIEKMFGTLATGGIVLMFGILTNCCYLIGYLIWWKIKGAPDDYNGDTQDAFGPVAVGFSGVLFALLMIETQLTAALPRSLCGVCMIPSVRTGRAQRNTLSSFRVSD
jgi:membrane associated rhomboid family serine protease